MDLTLDNLTDGSWIYMIIGVAIIALITAMSKTIGRTIINSINKQVMFVALAIITALWIGVTASTNNRVRIAVGNTIIKYQPLSTEDITKPLHTDDDMSQIADYIIARTRGVNLIQINTVNDLNNSRDRSFLYYDFKGNRISKSRIEYMVKLTKSLSIDELKKILTSDEIRISKFMIAQKFRYGNNVKIIRVDKHIYTRGKMLTEDWFKAKPDKFAENDTRHITDGYFIPFRDEINNRYYGWLTVKSISDDGITGVEYSSIDNVFKTVSNNIRHIIINKKTKLVEDYINEQIKRK